MNTDADLMTANPAKSWLVRRYRWVVASLLFCQALLAFASLHYDSVTFDELTHFTSGASYWQTSDFRLDPENPPLVNLWSSLPLRFVPHAPIDTHSKEWIDGDQWEMGRQWLNHRNDGERLLWYGRAMMIALLLCFSLTVFTIAKRIFGVGPALLALACLAFWPTVIAHGRLVTSDLPLGLFTLLALWRTERLLHGPTVKRWLLAALACGALFLTKYSAVLALPAFVALGVYATWRATKKQKPQNEDDESAIEQKKVRISAVLRPALLLVSLAFAAWLLIWSAYGWRYSMFADDLSIEQIREIVAENPQTADARVFARHYWVLMLQYSVEERDKVLVPFVVQQLEKYRVLPEAYLYGFMYTYHSAQGRSSYLMGDYADTGWWYYFPIAFLVKTPLALLAVVGLGVFATAQFRSSLRSNGGLVVVLATFLAVYVATSLTATINIGERHLLPIYGIVAIIAGLAAHFTRHPPGRYAIAGLLVWLAGANLLAFPDYLSYFNLAAGGRYNGHKWLVDSNIDWGQGLKRIQRYAADHPDEKIKLAYFGSAAPTTYLDCTALPSFQQFQPMTPIEPGTYIVSATQLYGIATRQSRASFWDDPQKISGLREMQRLASAPLTADAPPAAVAEQQEMRAELLDLTRHYLIHRLRSFPADARLGGGYFVYRLSEADLAQLLDFQRNRQQ